MRREWSSIRERAHAEGGEGQSGEVWLAEQLSTHRLVAVKLYQRRGPDLAAHYASMDVFAFPSVTETFGNVTIEALASGLMTRMAAAQQDLLGRVDGSPRRWVIDFGGRDEAAARGYAGPFARVEARVLPARRVALRAEEARNVGVTGGARGNRHHAHFLASWWQLSWRRGELLAAISRLPRYVVCARVSRRPVFEFVDARVRPGDSLVVFALADDYSFAVLQSSAHWAWLRARCSTLKRDWRYTSRTVFDSFPWPQAVDAGQAEEAVAEAAALLAVQKDQAAVEVAQRAVAAAEAVSSEHLRARARLVLAQALLGDERPTEAQREVQVAIDLAERVGDDELACEGMVVLLRALADAGEPAGADLVARLASSRAEAAMVGDRVAAMLQYHLGVVRLREDALSRAAGLSPEVTEAALGLPPGTGASFLAGQGLDPFHFPGAEALVGVLDLSADFRIKDPATYEEFYGEKHHAPELAAMSRINTLAEIRPNTSGHRCASWGTWSSSTKFSPNASPDPTVNHATAGVNRCGVTSSSLASRLTRNTASSATTMPTSAGGPGCSPCAIPNATGTPATRIAVSGDTTEIGPLASAA